MGGGAARGVAVAAFVFLASCTADAPEATPPSVDGAEACQAAVAAHVGKPADAVAVDWLRTKPDGIEVFEAVDGGRRHTCDVDAAGRVLRIDHPPE
jgi:hypothetical protein